MGLLYYCPASSSAYYYYITPEGVGELYVGNTSKKDPQAIRDWLLDHGAMSEVLNAEEYQKQFENQHDTRGGFRKWKI